MKTTDLYQLYLSCGGNVTTDSRNCTPDALFFALKGEKFNGNAFAAKALEAGCAYVIVDEADYIPANDARYILVDNCLKALQQLANYHRCRLGTPLIAITGTNGKTTTKELTATILSQAYRVLYTKGNLNNHIGVPLTLLRLKEVHQLGVIEMGASRPGDIKELVEIAEPDFGIITNVGKAHLEGFGSLEGVIQTKGELYDYLRTHQSGTIFIHHENDALMKMTDGLIPVFYGSDDNLYVNGVITGNSPHLSFRWKSGKEGMWHDVQTHLIGEYNFLNVLAAICIGRFFKVEPALMSKAIRTYLPNNSRSQWQQTAYNALIIDAYNANPTSMRASISNFLNLTADGKMLILGDMLELGKESTAEHQLLVDFIVECGFQDVVLVGNEFASVHHPFKVYPDVEALIQAVQTHNLRQKTILIKGSNGMKLDRVVPYL